MIQLSNHIRKINILIFISACILLHTTSAIAGKNDTKTKYPIILVHGFFDGGNHSTEPLTDGWYGITQRLAKGGAHVYEPDTSAFNSSYVRGEQLLDFLLRLEAKHQYGKYNLIGHSQGGIDSRYIASVRPDLVASVTVMGSPTFGSKLADIVLELGNLHPKGHDALSILLTIFGAHFDPDDPTEYNGLVNTLSSKGAREFNAIHPQAVPKKWCGKGKRKVTDGKNSVLYFSMSGTKPFTNWQDVPHDYLLAAGSLFFGGEENDGAVSKCSSHLGKVIKDNYSWNHLDEINQTNGLRGAGSANPVAVYRKHANRLKRLGL